MVLLHNILTIDMQVCDMSKLGTLLLVLMICFFSSGSCLAESMSLYALGVRYGTNDGTDKLTDLKRYDVFGVFNLPWSWQLVSNLDLDTRLITSAGMLDGEGDRGFIGTLGPGICLTDRNKRFSLELSGGIALLPDYRMGDEDFGGPLQFTFDVGIGVRLFKHLGLGYRIQHFSDAAIFGSDNRGGETQMFEISYRF
jgi:hypothetical protein